MAINDNKQGIRFEKTPDEVKALVREEGDLWHEYSRHRSKGAARSRLKYLKNSATFREEGFNWACRRRGDDAAEFPFVVYVSLNGDPEDIPTWDPKRSPAAAAS